MLDRRRGWLKVETNLQGEGRVPFSSGNSTRYTSFHLCSSVVFGGTRFLILKASSWDGIMVPSGKASVLVSHGTDARWWARSSDALLHFLRHLLQVCLPIVWHRYRCSFTLCTVGQPGPQHVLFCRNLPGLLLSVLSWVSCGMSTTDFARGRTVWTSKSLLACFRAACRRRLLGC